MTIQEKIKNKVYLFDGAMGTLFAAENEDYKKPCELANLDAPERVQAIHRAYIAAGCDAIKTNTFRVNPMQELYAAEEGMLEQVLQAGWRLAAECAAEAPRQVDVFADIGPIPAGAKASSDEKRAAFCRVSEIFLAQGAEHFIFETNSSDDGIPETAEFIHSKKPEAFVLVSLAVQPDGYTREGQYYLDLIHRLEECSGIDAIGLNCVSSALHMRMMAEGVGAELQSKGKLFAVMPNAGYPRVTQNRVFYNSDPMYFAEQTIRMAMEGAAIVGGCCGTTGDHLRALAEARDTMLRKMQPPEQLQKSGAEAASAVTPAKVRLRTAAALKKKLPQQRTDTPELEHNAFARKLENGKKVIAVELDPPRNADIAKYMSGAWTLKEAGVDAITIADCATARASMDSSIIACKLRRELGIDTIPHMTCRDRNMNATKALLLALCTEGVSNVLVVTGDPVPSAERDEVKSVFQFHSRMLASYIHSLNENEFPRPMRIYGALNLNVKKFDRELARAIDKVENGMQGFLTQPVLTEQAAENLKLAYETLRPRNAKLLGGIIPVVSSRNARYMDSEISGITVDPKITELYEGKSREECTGLAVEISTVIAERIADFVDGYYLMTPFSRTDIITQIVKNIKEKAF